MIVLPKRLKGATKSSTFSGKQLHAYKEREFCLKISKKHSTLSLAMEVLRKEFEQTLPLIEEAMSEADFIAIDTEFTGMDGTLETLYSLPY